MGQIFVDTWEAQGDLDEGTLLANGVYGIFMRLNDMNGGHHLDEYFLTQWSQAQNMLRVPYFVYNPWVDAQTNFSWLSANMPQEARALAIDIEVVYTGYPSSTYAQEVAKFYNLCSQRWNTVIYTGEWFLNNLAYWPTEANYWWAQYPLALYPPTEQYWTWDKLRSVISQYPRPFNESRCPGKVLMWQFTGDKLILPGSPREIDVNMAFMSEQEFSDWCGGVMAPPIVLPPMPIETHIGVTVYNVTRFGAPVVIHIIDPTKVDVWVSGKGDDFQTVAQTVTKNGASGGTNGGGWPYGQAYSNEIWKSRGTLLKSTALDDRPWMGFTTDKRIVFGRGIPPQNVTDAVGFDRYLGENGVFNEKYRYYKTKDARTFSGATADGKLILCVCQGNDMAKNGLAPYGLSFLEEWEVLKEFGCVTGGNNDGGSSSQVINKRLGNSNLITPSDGADAYVINAILFKAGVEMSDVIMYDKPEFWMLKSVIYVQPNDTDDIDQMGCGFAPVSGGFSGMTNWIELEQSELSLITRVNTIGDFPIEDKLRYACPNKPGAVWQYMGTTELGLPWRAWNIVIGSRLPYEFDYPMGNSWNIVKIVGKSSSGYYCIEGIPAGADLTQYNPKDHYWLFHRINVSDPSRPYSTDTPKGKMILPIFSPIGRKHATGDIVGTGIWIKPEYLYKKVSEVSPMTTPFDVIVKGVPNGIFPPKQLNIRESASLHNLGKVGFVLPGSRWQILELTTNADGTFGRINRDWWICLYNALKKEYYTNWPNI